jgi:hypothetical protein
MKPTNRVCCGIVCLLGIALTASTAFGQYRPLPAAKTASTGDRYYVEAGVMLLSPPLDATITSANFGIPSTPITLDTDLGMTSKARFELRLVLRPTARQKLRVSYLPQTFTSEFTLKRDLVFNGVRFSAGTAATSTYNWTGWRFSYEYDFVSNPSGFVGLVLEAKYTIANLEIKNATEREFVRAKAPLPAIGLIGRYCAMPNLCATGEVTWFGIPETSSKKYYARYLDFDLYGSYYLTNNVGVVAGYRSISAQFRVNSDSVVTSTRSPYLGGVVKF